MLGTVVALLLTLILGALAFTRFEPVPASPTAEQARQWNDHALDAAFQSVALGLGAAFSLLAAVACMQAYRGKPEPAPRDRDG